MSVSHTHDTGHGHELGFISKYIFSTDHKIIGIQFLISSMIFLFLGGFLALGVRTQLGWPHAEIPILGKWLWPGSAGHKMPPDTYNMLFTMHASVMIFFVIIPFLTGGVGHLLLPPPIGAADMAFPKLNMMSYWFMWPAGICMLLSFTVFGGAASNGWTSYPTIASIVMPAGSGVASPANMGSGWGQTLWLIGLLGVGISSMMG